MRNQKFYLFISTCTVILAIFNSGCENQTANSQLADTVQSNNSPVQLPDTQSNQNQVVAQASNQVQNKLALANHLQKIDAKFYGAFWCPYCKRQKELFGQEAIKKINYIECDPAGENPQPRKCEAAQIDALPTWEINGTIYPGYLTLEQLAEKSGYREDSSS